MDDYSALAAPVSALELREFRLSRRYRPGYAPQLTPLQLGLTLAGAGLVAIFVIGLSQIFVGVLREALEAGVSPATITAVVIPVVFAGGGVLVTATAARRCYAAAGSWERWLRLSRLQALRGEVFAPDQEASVRATLPVASAELVDHAGRPLRRGILVSALLFAIAFVATWSVPFLAN